MNLSVEGRIEGPVVGDSKSGTFLGKNHQEMMLKTSLSAVLDRKENNHAEGKALQIKLGDSWLENTFLKQFTNRFWLVIKGTL